ncbi:MAG TPA: hypothetical protein VMX79_11250 [bacterium]|nr:hypothetical protein [bacterium]
MKNLLTLFAGVVSVATLVPSAGLATGKVVTIGAEIIGHSVPWRGMRYDGMRFQCLWFQRDINYAGYINRVDFKYSSGSTSGAFNNCRVWLCHTTKTSLEATFDNNYAGKTPVQVLDTLSLELRGTEWIDVGISPGKFNYDNRDNLLMEIRWRGDSGNNIYCKIYNATGGRCYEFNDEAGSGTVYDQGQYIRLHIGTMAALEPTSLGRVRALYR